MERTKHILEYIITIILFLCCTTEVYSQPVYAGEIYKAYISGNRNKWVEIIQEMEKSSLSSTVEEKLELLNYYYGYIGYLIGNKEKSSAKKYLDKAKTTVDDVLKKDPSNATALAYKGTFIAYRMTIDKIRIPVLGPQSMKYIKKAYEKDPDNIQALADMGNMLYHAPSLFGGDKEKGISYIKKAISRIEETGKVRNNWNYLNLMVLQSRYTEEIGDLKTAMDIYEKILTVEPEFVWVRDELYPQIKTKIK
ncbi:MAG: hypothetical protein LIO93_01320 [Bacteroidales bacterium]|nr:hypothetical protein [Bacteroidales bacterium]